MKNKILDKKAGFSLIELVIVTGIIIIVLAISFSALLQSQSFQIYNNNFTKLYSLINNARSQAISGKGQADFTDFDLDNKTNTFNPPDYVTPGNYGVFFNTGAVTANKPNVALFADINPPQAGTTSEKGQFDPGVQYTQGNDLILDRLNLPGGTVLEVTDGEDLTPTESSIFYSPNYADITFENLIFNTLPFLTVSLTDNGLGICRQIKIHKLAGIPEISNCP